MTTHTEAELDALDSADRARRAAVTLHAAALYYAEQGLRVFPLQPGTKIPTKGSRGCHDATTDVERIYSWWVDYNPDCNIGIATGGLVDVVDIDGAIGQKSRATHWCAEGPGCDALDARPGEHPAELSDQEQAATCGHSPGIFATIEADAVAKVLTPRPGGMHLWVPSTGDGNSAGIAPGVDYRGKGGYVVAPPSVLIEGLCKPDDTPGTYRFLGTPDLGGMA